SYEVRVRRIWGEPLGGKVTVRVTRHQGTPQQTQELHRLALSSDGTAYLKVHLEDGRRTALTTVPPPMARRTDRAAAAKANPDRVFNMLRAMAEPAYSGMTKQGMAGGTSAAGGLAEQLLDAAPDIGPELVHQNKLATAQYMQTGADIMGQAVVSPDKKS